MENKTQESTSSRTTKQGQTEIHIVEKQSKTASETFVVGIQADICDICRKNKKVYLLRYGLTLCEDCLVICTHILEALQAQTNTVKAENEVSRT